MNKNRYTCQNCQFYAQHYLQMDHDFFKIDCGHCLKRYKISKPELCKYWLLKHQNEDWQTEIKETLQYLLNRINDIIVFLIAKE